MTAKMVTVRAQLRSATVHGEDLPIRGVLGTVSEPTTLELEFQGEHGPLRFSIPATKVPEWLRVRGDEWQTARFEVTLRRLRKAPGKVKRAARAAMPRRKKK